MKLNYGPYSPSRLDTAACPYSFYRQYVDENKVKRPEGVPQARGSVVHEVFEEFTSQYKSDPHFRWDDRTIHNKVAEAIKRHPAAVEELSGIIDMVQRYMAKPPRVLHADATVEERFAVKYNPETKQFLECSYDDQEAFIRGRGDIVSFSDDLRVAYLYDHKTQPNKEESDTFQLGVYAWIVSKIHPYLNEIRTILHFARYGVYSEHCIWVKNAEIAEALKMSGEVDPEYVLNLEELEDELLTRVSIAESVMDWSPRPHKGCIYCPVIDECPALKEILEVDAEKRLFAKHGYSIMGDTQQAVKVAGYITILEELVKGMKDELKEHVKLYGPIAIPGKRYCFKGEEAIDWDRVNKVLKNKVCAIFEEFGHDPRSFMGFSQTFSKSILFLENQALRDRLLALFPKKLSSEFRGVKY